MTSQLEPYSKLKFNRFSYFYFHMIERCELLRYKLTSYLEYNSLTMPTSVFTWVGEFIVMDRVYISCDVLLILQNAWIALVISYVVDFVLH